MNKDYLIKNRRFVRSRDAASDRLKTDAMLIWHPKEREAYYDRPKNSYCCFRHSFTLKDKAKGSKLRIFADSRYILYVNGEYITKGPARSDPAFQYYDELDISDYLVEDENTIAVMVLYFGYGTGASMDRIPALFVDCEISLSNGNTISVKTNDEWLCQKSDAFLPNPPRINGCKGPCQMFDNRKYDENWMNPQFDDSGWVRCHARGTNCISPFRNLLKRPIPQLVEHPVDALGIVAEGYGKTVEETDNAHFYLSVKQECTEMEILRHELKKLPADMISPEGEYSVLCVDFGKVTTGYLNLEIDGRAGAVLDVIFAEAKNMDFRPYFDGTSYRPLSRFILREGTNHLQNFFNYDALRYAYIIYRGDKATLKRAWISATVYPLEKTAVFNTDNKKLQKLWDISVHTVKLCMLDGFVDSPSREQQQWIGDARWQGTFNAYISGDMRMLKKVLYQFAQSQDFEGMIASRYPDENINWAPIPTNCFQWIDTIGEYYDFTGDLTPIIDLYDHMVSGIRWFTTFERDDGLIWDTPYWRYIDMGTNAYGRQGDFYGKCATSVENLRLLGSLKVMHRFAVLLKDKQAAAFYKKYITRLAKNIHKNFWSKEKECVVDCIYEGNKQSDSTSELVNALALLNLYEPDSYEAKSIISNIFDLEQTPKELVRVDLFYMPIFIKSLVKHGKIDLVYRKTMERYSEMLSDKVDATSTWENFILYNPDGSGNIFEQRSACHGWGASGVLLVAEALCGVEFIAGEPNLNRTLINPKLDFEVKLYMPNNYVLDNKCKNGINSIDICKV